MSKYDDDAKGASESEGEDDFKGLPLSPARKPYKTGRRATVSAAPVTVAADWEPPVYKKTASEYQQIKKSVSRNFLFQHLDEKDLDIIIQAMKLVSFEPGENIINQGEVGDRFYIVEEGQCDIFVKGVGKVMEVVGGSGARNYFGELSLLYDAPRAATVTAMTEVQVWALDRVTFKKILQDTAQKQQDLYRHFLEQVPLLQALTKQERMVLADALSPKKFAQGEAIIEEGDEGHEFFIIETGSVVCTKTVNGRDVEVCDPLGPGDYFGELALLNDDRRRATVRALRPTTCLTLGRETFKRLLGPLETLLKGREEVYEKYNVDKLGAGGK